MCHVDDIAALSGSVSQDLYYVLQPLFGDSRNSIVRVPVNNAISLRPAMSKKEVEDALKLFPSFKKDLYITDSKARKVAYENALAAGDIVTMAPLLAGAKQRRQRDGHLNSMDGQFVAKAEPIVYGVISLGLDIPYEEVGAYIEKRFG
ncbi:MAG: hypothetical protein K6F32_06180 [Bacilli bacterium]|nr:hypothetical protein [Bacilli bacterium]